MIDITLFSDDEVVKVYEIALNALVDVQFREKIAMRLELTEMALTKLTDKVEATLEYHYTDGFTDQVTPDDYASDDHIQSG